MPQRKEPVIIFILSIVQMERSCLVDILRHKKSEKILNIDGEIEYLNSTWRYYVEFKNKALH